MWPVADVKSALDAIWKPRTWELDQCRKEGRYCLFDHLDKCPYLAFPLPDLSAVAWKVITNFKSQPGRTTPVISYSQNVQDVTTELAAAGITHKALDATTMLISDPIEIATNQHGQVVNFGGGRHRTVAAAQRLARLADESNQQLLVKVN